MIPADCITPRKNLSPSVEYVIEISGSNIKFLSRYTFSGTI